MRKKKRWLAAIKFSTFLVAFVLIIAFFFDEFMGTFAMAFADDAIYSMHVFGDWEEETSPTCQREGVEISKCLYCNVTKRRITSKFPHCYVGEVTVTPTIYSDGEKTYTCIWCGDTYTEVVPAKSMTFYDTFVSPEDDLDGSGYVLHTCYQDETYSYKSPLTYTSKVYEPNCNEQGYTLYTCNEGDYSYKADYTEKTNHNWVETSRYAPNCDDTGVIYYKCTICYANYTVTMSNLGHKFVLDSSKNKAATCTTAGRYYGTCSVCGWTKDEIIPALGHDYVLNKTKSVASTCTEAGYNYYVCSRCGDAYIIDLELLGHSLIHYEAVEATLSRDGNIEYWYCTACGKYFADEDATEEITEDDIIVTYKSTDKSDDKSTETKS